MTNFLDPASCQNVSITRLFEIGSADEHSTKARTLAAQRTAGCPAENLEVTLDFFSQTGAACCFVRFTAGLARDLRITLGGNYRVATCTSGGWLLMPKAEHCATYWVPLVPRLRFLDDSGRILEERAVKFSGITVASDELVLQVEVPADWTLDYGAWRFSQNSGSLIDAMDVLLAVELLGYFLSGSHTRYELPASLYRHLVRGWVYEDGFSWPHKRRICSENDAYALYLIFGGLERRTGKQLYRLLKQQLLLAVLSRQSEDGAFRHGEWTDGMESHFRLHCSAMHLMMDALAEGNDASVRAALVRAAAYIADKFDDTAIGAWFYHDELECSEVSMRRAPFEWWPSRALGKSPQNMLVLNTQLDTLVALDRYRTVTGDDRYAERIQSGFSAAAKVLALRPQEWLYRLLFSAINLTLLPTELAAQLPIWKRMWKRVGWQFFIPWLPRIKTRFPRLVMPGGYIDRELSLQTWAYDYLAVNLMDLVRAARGDRAAVLMPYIDGIIAFCDRTSIAKRWLENPGKAYAVGFYAEALYLLALRVERTDVDAALASALVLAMRHGLGLPPSINGGNREAQPLTFEGAVPQPAMDGVVVADLSAPGHGVILVVNCGNSPISMQEGLCEVPSGWQLPPEPLPSGGWMRIRGSV